MNKVVLIQKTPPNLTEEIKKIRDLAIIDINAKAKILASFEKIIYCEKFIKNKIIYKRDVYGVCTVNSGDMNSIMAYHDTNTLQFVKIINKLTGSIQGNKHRDNEISLKNKQINELNLAISTLTATYEIREKSRNDEIFRLRNEISEISSKLRRPEELNESIKKRYEIYEMEITNLKNNISKSNTEISKLRKTEELNEQSIKKRCEIYEAEIARLNNKISIRDGQIKDVSNEEISTLKNEISKLNNVKEIQMNGNVKLKKLIEDLTKENNVLKNTLLEKNNADELKIVIEQNNEIIKKHLEDENEKLLEENNVLKKEISTNNELKNIDKIENDNNKIIIRNLKIELQKNQLIKSIENKCDIIDKDNDKKWLKIPFYF